MSRKSHETSLGYVVKEHMSGLDVYDEYGDFVCELSGASFSDYEDEYEEIDDDVLENDIKHELDVRDFLNEEIDY